MPKFKPGDIVLVNGRKQEIRSWPHDDQGPFTSVYKNKDGGEVWNTQWIGAVEIDGDPVYEAVSPELVEEGTAPESTLSLEGIVETDSEADATDEAAEVAQAEPVE